MHIWVDADACPKLIKSILLRAVTRTQTPIILVANQSSSTQSSALVKIVTVAAGLDVADQYIVEHLHPGDLVITADIPLAAAVVVKGAHALNPRGELYTKENIQQRLAVRDFATHLRASGVITGGPAAITKKEIQLFANALDRFLSRQRPVMLKPVQQ